MKNCGYDQGQAYYFARPILSEEFKLLLDKQYEDKAQCTAAVS